MNNPLSKYIILGSIFRGGGFAVSLVNDVVYPIFDLTLHPGDSPSTQLYRFREVIFTDVFVNRGSGEAGAVHDLFDTDQFHAHDGLLVFVHEMTHASINLIRE